MLIQLRRYSPKYDYLNVWLHPNSIAMVEAITPHASSKTRITLHCGTVINVLDSVDYVVSNISDIKSNPNITKENKECLLN